MKYNYLKTALRQFNRHRAYTLLHLLGLTAGVAACLLMASYVWHESRFDRFHANGDRIFRLNTDLSFPDRTLELALAAGPAAPALQEELPGIENFARLTRPWSRLLIGRDETRAFENSVYYADSTFFALFDFPLLQGDADRALAAPFTAVITPEKALAYFGPTDPLGEHLTIDGRQFEVTGVVAAPPRNSHLRFDFLLSFSSWAADHPYSRTSWTWTPFSTYLLLADPSAADGITAQLPAFLDRRLPPGQRETPVELHLEPFEKIHFNEARLGEPEAKGSRQVLVALSFCAFFILLLAIANYINLATALYAARAREIGVRKTVGATRAQIMGQYLTEGVILCLPAVAAAAALSRWLLPLFGRWLDRDLVPEAGYAPLIAAGLLLFAVGLGSLAALYPALLLSRLRPVLILKGQTPAGPGSEKVRRLLTVLQFSVAVALLLGVFAGGAQMRYLLNKDLGFRPAGKIILDFGSAPELRRSYTALAQELTRAPGVEGVTFSSHVPADAPHGVSATIRKIDGSEVTAETELYLVDTDFLELYGLKIIAGRSFLPQDTAGALILNRSSLQLLGFSSPQEAIGREFRQWEGQGRVIGVVEDFNYKSLHQKIGAITFQFNPALFEKATIQLASADDLPARLEALRARWNGVAGHLPFQYSFLDDRLAGQYAADRRLTNLITVFGGLALLLACLGLVGLVAYTCRRRAKSIAVRKVFGARAGDIILGLCREFSRPVLWAWLLAVGPALWLLNRWLDGFAYHITLNAWLPLAAGGLILVLVGVVVSWQSFRTANANPVRYLREE